MVPNIPMTTGQYSWHAVTTQVFGADNIINGFQDNEEVTINTHDRLERNGMPELFISKSTDFSPTTLIFTLCSYEILSWIFDFMMIFFYLTIGVIFYLIFFILYTKYNATLVLKLSACYFHLFSCEECFFYWTNN